MKVVVIGAGIIGCLTACRLKQQGADVLILEKGALGKESSWAGAGILCPIHPWLYPDAFSQLIDASLALYPDLEQELESATGISIQRIQSGLIIPCFADDITPHQSQALAWSQRFHWNMQQLTRQQSLSLEPTLSNQLSESLYWPEVYQVRNPALLKAVHMYLKQLNIPIHVQSEVTALCEDDQSNIIGVSTISGKTYAADAVLLATGSWSHELAKQSGFVLPVLPVKGQIILLNTPANTLKHIIKHDNAYFVPRQDGRILVGASMENVGFLRGNTVAGTHALLSATLQLLPGLNQAVIEQQWMGFRPGSPDGLPFLGPIHSKKGLWVATGHYRNGVALAPITANIMADWILGQAPSLDMTAFSAQRTITNNTSVGYPT